MCVHAHVCVQPPPSDWELLRQVIISPTSHPSALPTYSELLTSGSPPLKGLKAQKERGNSPLGFSQSPSGNGLTTTGQEPCPVGIHRIAHTLVGIPLTGQGSLRKGPGGPGFQAAPLLVCMKPWFFGDLLCVSEQSYSLDL